jgi:hypothetical protein
MLAFVSFSGTTDHLSPILGIEWLAGALLFGLVVEFLTGIPIFSAMDVRPWKNGWPKGIWCWDGSPRRLSRCSTEKNRGTQR